MGGAGTIRDVIVVGMGPAGAAAASMLRAPERFGLAGTALDVVAVEQRAGAPTRERIVGIREIAQPMLHQADEVAGMAESTVVADVASIAGVERTLRAAAANVGVETLYGVAPRRFEARAGVVTLQLTDGTTLRARHMIDASGGRLGVFDRGPERGSTVYLTGQLPPFDDAGYFRAAEPVAVSGRTGRAFESTLFGFVDARTAATVFVEYPSVPLAAADATTAHRLLTRHLDDSGVDPEGLYDAQFIRTPHLRSEYAVRGPVLGIGDTVRRVSPKTGAGVAHAIVDARAAAKALHSAAQAPRLAPIAFANFEYGVLARGAAGL